MTNESEINKRCRELFDLLAGARPDATRCHVLLLELRSLSDKSAADGTPIPIEAFECMGPELRMCCFDVFLGVMASSLNIVLPEPKQS